MRLVSETLSRESWDLLDMKYFKLPLIVTAIVLPLMLVCGIGAIVWISGLDIPSREKTARASMLGSGVATMGCFIMAPFWLIAAAKFGKAKREARDAKKANRRSKSKRAR